MSGHKIDFYKAPHVGKSKSFINSRTIFFFIKKRLRLREGEGGREEVEGKRKDGREKKEKGVWKVRRPGNTNV